MSSHNILIAGECLIDLFPVNDSSSIEREMFQRRAGGAPANVAVALSRLGHPPLLWTSIGEDSFGNYLKSVLEQFSVPSQLIIQREDDPTGLALVDNTIEGGFELYIDGTATINFNINDLSKTLFTELEWVHLGGVLLAREPARTAMFELLERAKAHNCTISFDPNTRPSIWTSTDKCIDVLNQVLDTVDVVVGHTDDFPSKAFPRSPTALADELLDRGAAIVAITKGAAGAELKTRADSPWGEYYSEHPGFEVDAVDTTGAGDAFTATLIASLRDEDTKLTETLSLSNASGAIVTTQTGAISTIPDQETVREWLQARNNKKC